MSILLTREELDKLWEEWEKADPFQETDFGITACKAQLKEVVEEFKKYELALEHDNRVFVYPNKLWQALLKEIE